MKMTETKAQLRGTGKQTGGLPGFLFIVPSLIGTTVFYLFPYMDVFRRAFAQTVGGGFAGFDNFVTVLRNEAFGLAMKNTFLFIGVCIPILLVLSLFIAVAIYGHTGIGKYIKTGLLFPMAVSVSSVVLVWKFLFDGSGFINGVLNSLGAETHDWMRTDFAFAILVGSYIWKNLGYNVVLWLAGLSTIPSNIYEAARVDGAGAWRCFRYITFPNLKSSLFVICVLAILNSFKVFREAYLVAGEYPHRSIYLIQHLFNNWFRDLALDKMAAGAVVNSIILIGLVALLQIGWNRKG